MRYRYHWNDHGAWSASSPACFVFGSNTGGRHGAGAAQYANKRLGFPWLLGEGYGGGDGFAAYAIPTVRWGARGTPGLSPMPLGEVAGYVRRFLVAAGFTLRDDGGALDHFVSAVGTGLAGFDHGEVAPLFRGAPNNCIFPLEWAEYLED